MSKAPNKGMMSAGRPSSRLDRQKEATLASLADKGEVRRVNIVISKELHDKLRMHCIREDTNMKELLTEYIKSLPD